jgi:hypothetical protein
LFMRRAFQRWLHRRLSDMPWVNGVPASQAAYFELNLRLDINISPPGASLSQRIRDRVLGDRRGGALGLPIPQLVAQVASVLMSPNGAIDINTHENRTGSAANETFGADHNLSSDLKEPELSDPGELERAQMSREQTAATYSLGDTKPPERASGRPLRGGSARLGRAGPDRGPLWRAQSVQCLLA